MELSAWAFYAGMIVNEILLFYSYLSNNRLIANNRRVTVEVVKIRNSLKNRAKPPSIETHIFFSTCPVEFKNGLNKIIEFRPCALDKGQKLCFWGNILLNNAIFFSNEKHFP